MKLKNTKIVLAFKKDGRLTQAKLNISKDYIDYLDINENSKKVKIIYENNQFSLEKLKDSDIIENIERRDQNNNLLFFQTSKELTYSKAKLYKDKEYFSFKLFIPFAIIEAMKIFKENQNILIQMKEKKLIINQSKNNQEGKMKGKIITFKVNKGGVGKTFLTTQFGHTLAIYGKKVLILTSDSQNNVLNFLYKGKVEFKKGLKAEVKERGTGELYKLRSEKSGGELYFLPLEDNNFSTTFPNNLKKYLQQIREEYDFILIDSVPTLKLDKTFLDCSDKVIIPCYCDDVTINGVLNLLEEIDLEKVLAIMINRFEKTATQKKYLEKLKKALDGKDILFPEPIPKMSFVEKMLDNKKSIWEYKNQSTAKLQDIIAEVLIEIIE